ncbi:MAG: hypothetical protein U1E14_18310 [Geminicoccaceae bacterium]
MALRFRSLALSTAPSLAAAAFGVVAAPGAVGLDLLAHTGQALLLLGAAALLVGRAGLAFAGLGGVAGAAAAAAALSVPQAGLGGAVALAVLTGLVITVVAGLLLERLPVPAGAVLTLAGAIAVGFLLPAAPRGPEVALPRNLWIAPVLVVAGLVLARRVEGTAGATAAALLANPRLRAALPLDRTRLVLPLLAMAGLLAGAAGGLGLFDEVLTPRDEAIRSGLVSLGVALAVLSSAVRDLAGTLAWGLPILVVPLLLMAAHPGLDWLLPAGVAFGAVVALLRWRLLAARAGHA